MSSWRVCTSGRRGCLMRDTRDPDTELMMSLSRLCRKYINFTLFLLRNLSYIFSVLHRDPAILDGLDLTEEEKTVLIDNINRRLTPQAVKIRAGDLYSVDGTHIDQL